MTIDEHIHKAEEDAKMAEFDTVWGMGNYFIDRTEALKYAKECRQLAEWLKDYKRLLEQEPCEDAVSRKALISHIENQSRKWGEDYDAQQILGDIEDMPSVKPQEPKTVLYSGDGYADGYMVYDMAECPNCGYEYILIHAPTKGATLCELTTVKLAESEK